jgi:hypothetical protein
MDRTTAALLRALDDVGPRLRALGESAAPPDAPPPDPQMDEAAEQLLRAFVALLREALEGGREQRDLVFPTAVPALVAAGQTALEIVEGHVSFFMVLSAQLLDAVGADVRDDASVWLARYAGEYVREVTEIALAAERDAGGGSA